MSSVVYAGVRMLVGALGAGAVGEQAGHVGVMSSPAPSQRAFAGAGAGAAGGRLIGALVGWGIPEERVKHYEDGIRNGGILMGIKPRFADDAEVLENAWRSSNGTQIYR